MPKREKVRDTLDIKETLEGSISKVIARLQELQAEYPDGVIEITTESSYGDDYYAAATLNFYRKQTAIEAELDGWNAKADQYAALSKEAGAFSNNGIPYPRADEKAKLKQELGFFAMAPMRGTLVIYNNEILVHDERGARRRDGTFVMISMRPPSDNDAMAKIYARIDSEYLPQPLDAD